MKEFIGKTVINAQTKRRFVLREITAPYIDVEAEKPDSAGNHACYRYSCVNGDPISAGKLVFDDPALTESFKKAYSVHCHSQKGYWEDYGYWLRKG